MTTIFRRRRAALIWIVAAAAVAVAGCGSGSDSSQSGTYGKSSSTASGPTSAQDHAAVELSSTKLGDILVDGDGRTLYLFEADKGTTSTCDGECAVAWPPLTTTGKPTAGDGVAASKLGTTKRSDGTTEVTYNGHPLYFYAGDSAPGDTNGQGIDGFGAEWYVLSAAGDKIEATG